MRRRPRNDDVEYGQHAISDFLSSALQREIGRSTHFVHLNYKHVMYSHNDYKCKGKETDVVDLLDMMLELLYRIPQSQSSITRRQVARHSTRLWYRRIVSRRVVV